MREKRTVSVFYIVYFALIVLFLAALFAGLQLVKDYLGGYEASLPIRTMEAVAEEYFLADDKTELLLKSGFEVPRYSSVNDVIAYLDTVIDSEDLHYYSVGGDERYLTYSVVSGQLKVATVTLELSDTPDGDGFPVYSLSDIELTIGGSSGVSIQAPVGYTVYVNGYELGAEQINGEPEPSESCSHMYGDAVGISIVTYKLTGIFGEPKVSAVDNNGNSVQGITSDEENVFYNVPVNYGEIPEDLAARVLAASECYAAYMQKDMEFGRIAAYVDRSSELYTNLRTSAVKWANPHRGYSIVDPEITEFYFYNDDVFSCRVRFVHLLHGYGGNDFENEFDMTFYLRNVYGKYMIYDSHVN